MVETGSAKVVWAQAIYLPNPATTNNQAELTGAMAGLRRLHALDPPVCTVVGDSNLLISLFRTHRSPKARHLQDPYRQARRIADSLKIREWRHHFREHNTMADTLANYAMDTKTTITIRPGQGPSSHQRLLTQLQALCLQDLQPWLLRAADWRPP
jgi:ribonuclease HI